MSSPSSSGQDPRAAEVLSLVGEHMPTNSSSPMAGYLPGFTSLRLMLMKTDRTSREAEVLGTILESYSSYVSSGKPTSEIAWLLARDCMHLSQQTVSQPQVVSHQQQAVLPSQAMNGLAAAAALPQAQVNGGDSFTPAPASIQSAQRIQGMALPTAQPLHLGAQQQYSLLPQAQPFPGMPPAPASQQQQNGQGASSS